MGRKMIVISDDNDFIVAAENFCESYECVVKSYTPTEWSRQVNSPDFMNTLVGDTKPGGHKQPTTGAKILQFPSGGTAGGDRLATMNELESVAIRNAIYNFNGNLTEAAKALGIGRATLYRKVKLYNIDIAVARRRRAA
ncbi:MAG: hypothetical protein A2Z20_10470 [Bdellovibrionales bacterium RBG_16_40_8]|nr:MAG: hypothetical protein A2Z20_10470 [Bdellovibrionales bacterium RBG_16_40_8]